MKAMQPTRDYMVAKIDNYLMNYKEFYYGIPLFLNNNPQGINTGDSLNICLTVAVHFNALSKKKTKRTHCLCIKKKIQYNLK